MKRRRYMRRQTILVLVTALAVTLLQTASTAGPKGVRKGRVAVSAQGERAMVKISNFKFEPKSLTVTAGTTVEWVNDAGRHAVESDDGKSFKSDVITAGGKFEFKFDKPGTYAYHCPFHGEKGGKDMAVKIIVKGAAKKK